jgi:hypothetical protein
MSNIFCWAGLHATSKSSVTFSCYLQATTNESNHRAHRGRTVYQEYCGTFDPSPNPESHDNSMTTAGPPVGCLGECGLPSGPGPRFRSAPWARWARLRALASGGRWPDERCFCSMVCKQHSVCGYYYLYLADRQLTTPTTKITKLTKDAQRHS